ncbi:M23 family metallopeptidase [Micromonospora sp. NPDC049679]|uniref:M23 family metallopeptidase n=1 Tax=Micromonospora sp. NPDC049679 TaxID=3155920 RepID=UPI0033D2D431
MHPKTSREKRSEGGARTVNTSDRIHTSIREVVLRFAVLVGFLVGGTAVAAGTGAGRPAQAATAVNAEQARGDGARFAQVDQPLRPPAERGKKAKWVSPMPGAEVTSCWERRWGTMHKGIDYAEPENTPVNAASAGKVYGVGRLYSGYGISVVIDHGNGIFTHYAHLNKTTVKHGRSVEAGQLIGREGSTGDSTGPHLHFEVHRGLWKQLNPAPWMRARGVDVKC